MIEAKTREPMAGGYSKVYSRIKMTMLGLRHQHKTEHKLSEQEKQAIDAGKLEKYQAVCVVCGYPAVGACFASCHKEECRHKP